MPKAHHNSIPAQRKSASRLTPGFGNGIDDHLEKIARKLGRAHLSNGDVVDARLENLETDAELYARHQSGF